VKTFETYQNPLKPINTYVELLVSPVVFRTESTETMGPCMQSPTLADRWGCKNAQLTNVLLHF